MSLAVLVELDKDATVRVREERHRHFGEQIHGGDVEHIDVAHVVVDPVFLAVRRDDRVVRLADEGQACWHFLEQPHGVGFDRHERPSALAATALALAHYQERRFIRRDVHAVGPTPRGRPSDDFPGQEVYFRQAVLFRLRHVGVLPVAGERRPDGAPTHVGDLLNGPVRQADARDPRFLVIRTRLRADRHVDVLLIWRGEADVRPAAKCFRVELLDDLVVVVRVQQEQHLAGAPGIHHHVLVAHHLDMVRRIFRIDLLDRLQGLHVDHRHAALEARAVDGCLEVRQCRAGGKVDLGSIRRDSDAVWRCRDLRDLRASDDLLRLGVDDDHPRELGL